MHTNTNPTPNPARAYLGEGWLRHRRHTPRSHVFAYRSWFWWLPMRSLAASDWAGVRRNRWGPTAFYDADHGTGGGDALQWCEQCLQAAGITDADGEIWLQTFPRVFGYVFKPVSFWFAHSRDGRLRAVVAEVNNTFGERHVYVLAGADLRWGQTLRARKAMHVSPFTQVEGEYRFRFQRRWRADLPRQLVSCVDHVVQGQTVLQTSWSGVLRPLTASSSARVQCRMPAMTLAVIVRIHWQALQLWAKRVPWFRKPNPPGQSISLRLPDDRSTRNS